MLELLIGVVAGVEKLLNGVEVALNCGVADTLEEVAGFKGVTGTNGATGAKGLLYSGFFPIIPNKMSIPIMCSA
jgi:hypothetical protein